MDIYRPVAGMSVNILVIIGLGGVVGLLTGMIGVGGGFLTTPILIFYGIPPSVAVASATTQITGTSVSGMLRSEEHTSELQSLMRISYAVFCLKKKKKRPQPSTNH